MLRGTSWQACYTYLLALVHIRVGPQTKLLIICNSGRVTDLSNSMNNLQV